MQPIGLEALLVRAWGANCAEEVPLGDWRPPVRGKRTLCIPAGFEDRSRAVLEGFCSTATKVDRIFVGQYVRAGRSNRSRGPKRTDTSFEDVARRCVGAEVTVLDNFDDGTWVAEAIAASSDGWFGVDITGLSAKGLFGVLDRLAGRVSNLTLFYTEAEQYWPTRLAWHKLRLRSEARHVPLSVQADTERWLYGSEHQIELLPNHEGYGVAGSAALVAFLPFKASRLAAVMSGEDYSEYVFVAGVPRLAENRWRLDAVKIINEPLIGSWQVEEMATFGYMSSLRHLGNILLAPGSILEKSDVHLAVLGSKLQTLACWMLSTVVPGIAVVTSTPDRYYTHAFSAGRGFSWAIDFVVPDRLRLVPQGRLSDQGK